MAETPTIFTTGTSGAGKTFYRCAVYLADTFLRYRTGVHYSNFPVEVDALIEYLGKQGWSAGALEKARERVKVIPDEEIAKWKKAAEPCGRGKAPNLDDGPWEFFRDPDKCGMPATTNKKGERVADLSRMHLAIDEWHNFCGRKSHVSWKAKWQSWLGELRHMGCTFEGVSQKRGKLAQECLQEAGVRYTVVNGEMKQDPLFLVEWGDWWELKAKLFGWMMPYRKGCWVKEEIEDGNGGWRFQREDFAWIRAPYWNFYRTNNETELTGQSGESELPAYKRLNVIMFLLYFAGKNWKLTTCKRLFMVSAVAALLIFCGIMREKAGWIFTLPMQYFVAAGDGRTDETKAADGDLVIESTQREAASAAVAAVPVAAARSAIPAQVYTPPLQQVAHTAGPSAEQERAGPAVQRGHVTAMFPDEVWFSDAGGYRVGDEIDMGGFKGERVQRINFRDSKALLSVTGWVRLGEGMQPAEVEEEEQHESGPGATGSSIPGSLRTVERRSASIPAEVTRR